MNIHYRIVKVDPEAHGILIRYWTDKVTEMDLAGPLNPDGTPQLNADGYPLATRTDVFMSFYDTPTPTPEEIDRRIMLQAPVDWLRLQEAIKDPDIDTKMRQVRDLTGESKVFTEQDIDTIRKEIIASSEADVVPTEEDLLHKAYDTVNTFMDAVKVLVEKDPEVVKELSQTINEIVNTQ